MANIELICRDCGSTFIFKDKDQKFFNKMGFSNPVRCPNCRAIKKQQRIGMNNE